MLGLLALPAFGQSGEDRRVTIHIEENEEGNLFSIDTAFSIDESADLEEILRELGIESDLEIGDNNVEIIINKRAAIEDELGQLRIELNEIMPDVREQMEELERELMELRENHVFRADRDRGAFLGVYYESHMQDNAWSAEVTSVIEGTGADAAGLREGDRIRGIDGNTFTAGNEIHTMLGEYSPGDEVELIVIREGREVTVPATLGQTEETKEFHWMDDDHNFEFQWEEGDHNFDNFRFFPDEEGSMNWEEKPFLGVYLDYTEAEGARISGAVEGSTAESLGLQEGDVITSINGTDIPNTAKLKEAIEALKVGETVSVTYTREGVSNTVSTELRSKGCNTEGFMLKEGLHDAFGNLEEMLEETIIINGEGLDLELMEDLEQLRQLEDLNIFFSEDEFEGEDARIVRSVAIFITMDNISNSEAEQINENSDNRISTTNDLAIEGVYFAPNPSDGRFNLNFDLVEDGRTAIRVYDISGREVYATEMNAEAGSYTESIDISDEPKGTYFIQITQNGKNWAKKVVIQ